MSVSEQPRYPFDGFCQFNQFLREILFGPGRLVPPRLLVVLPLWSRGGWLLKVSIGGSGPILASDSLPPVTSSASLMLRGGWHSLVGFDFLNEVRTRFCPVVVSGQDLFSIEAVHSKSVEYFQFILNLSKFIICNKLCKVAKKLENGVGAKLGLEPTILSESGWSKVCSVPWW